LEISPSKLTFKNTISPISTKRTITSHWTQKRLWHMTLEFQVLAWNRHKHVAGYPVQSK
jgi:hypothetical protein